MFAVLCVVCRTVERERERVWASVPIWPMLWKKREKIRNASVRDEFIHHCWINNPFGCVLNKHLRNYKSIWKYPIFRCLMNASESKKEKMFLYTNFFLLWMLACFNPKTETFFIHFKSKTLSMDSKYWSNSLRITFWVFSMDCSKQFFIHNDRKIWIYFKRFEFIFWGFIHRNGIRLKCKWNLNYDAYRNATDMQPTQNGSHGGYKQTYFKCHCWK